MSQKDLASYGIVLATSNYVAFPYIPGLVSALVCSKPAQKCLTIHALRLPGRKLRLRNANYVVRKTYLLRSTQEKTFGD